MKYHFDFKGDKLIIGKFCMIASGVSFIMIGANHLVEAISTYLYAVAGGSPAKEIRKRFSGEHIEYLLYLKWWDWPFDKITKNLWLLTGNNLEDLKKLASKDGDR